MKRSSVINRRDFLQTTTVAAAGLTTLTSYRTEATSATKAGETPDIIDTNVTLGHWPFRRVPLDEAARLVEKLRKLGVVEIWAGSFDALFQKDLAAANTRLVEACRNHGRGFLLPFGSVNPRLPDWEEDLRRCHEIHKMAGLRLHPNYHGYRLDDPRFGELLARATECGMVVQIAVSMEDERMQSALARVPHVDVKPLLPLLAKLPAAHIELLNWHRAVSATLIKQLAASGVCFDIATVEGVGGVANLIGGIGGNQAMFGSHAPLFYFESALLKLQESALMGDSSRAVRSVNARRLRAAAKTA